MKIYKSNNLSIQEPTVWGIGVFDGVHRGHQALIQRVCEMAEAAGAAPGLLTFEPHPSSVLRRKPVPRLTTLDEKLALVEPLGIRACWVVEFNDAFSKIPAKGFLDEYLTKRSAARGAVVGFDFTFGRDARGDAKYFKEWSARHGIQSAVLPAVKSGALKVGSSTIREWVGNGQIQQANLLLGRPYFAFGDVVHGAGRGKGLGFPTVNLRLPEEKLVPKTGVYLVEVRLSAGAATPEPRYRGLCDIGHRPTFEGPARPADRPTVEVFIEAFSGDLYGRTLRVDFLKFLRNEMKFDTIDMLREQIRKDVEEMKQYEYSEAG